MSPSRKGLARIGRHLLANRARVRKAFSPRAFDAIEAAIKASETQHAGQLRFVVEGALDGAPLFRDQATRERALDIFAQLRVWDTEHNNGVLIYLLLADHQVEIVADRGIAAKVEQVVWDDICKTMERAFGKDEFEQGVLDGIAAITAQLARHFPREAGGVNELPDTPVVI